MLQGVLKVANAAEFDHYKTLRGLGAKSLTTRFWAPNAFFASSNDGFATLWSGVAPNVCPSPCRSAGG
jgi:hypothetical protein